MRRIRVVGGPWPERIGCEGYDVTHEMNPKIYPRHGLGRNERVIRLDADPLIDGTGPSNWSCVLGSANLEEIKEDT